MGKQFSLSQMREQYLLGKIGKKQLEGSIFQYLLKNCERIICRGDDEQWYDFIAELYPRISRAVDAYQDIGSSFDSYINTLIHWAYKEYKSRKTSHGITEYTCWQARTEELAVHSAEPEYSFENPSYQEDPALKEEYENCEIPKPMLLMREHLSSRQILILFLKSYYFVSDNLTARVAGFLKMKKEDLAVMVDKLHKTRAKREDEIREIETGMFCQYYRCLSYEKRLYYTAPGSASREKLKSLLARARRRFKRMRKRLYGIRFDATNQQIAEILNIPKGTIDSALNSIRKKSGLYGFIWEKPLYSKIDEGRGTGKNTAA